MKSSSLSESALRKAGQIPDGERIYFHVYNQGVNRQAIFTSGDNYDFLLNRMTDYSTQLGVTVVVYCLMPTHYHFLIETENREQASRFVQKLFNSYSQAFNQQQNRTGTLFESRAKFRLIETDEYALQLCCYIHLNPVKAGLTKKPEQWKYSKYLGWIDQKTDNQGNLVLRFFDNPKEYEKYVHSSLAKG
ncbi:MAG: transposase [Chloroflexi bacterium]|nr:transposase [Chloroflexota bacterium]